MNEASLRSPSRYGEQPAYGNPKGLGILADIAFLKETAKSTNEKLEATKGQLDNTDEKLEAINGQLDNTKGRLKGTEGRLTDMEGQLKGTEGRLTDVEGRLENTEGRLKVSEEKLRGTDGFMRATDASFLAIRDLYLENYRRHVLGWSSNYRLITEGNGAAHSGNAVYDALVYKRGYRQDEDLLLEIYGLNQQEILELDAIGDTESIAVLNARATLRADTQHHVDGDLDIAWKEYIAVLKSNWGQNMQADPMSDIARCRAAFWKIATQYDRFFKI